MTPVSRDPEWAHYVRFAKAIASSDPKTHDPKVEAAKQLADSLLQLRNTAVISPEMTASGEKRELSFATDLFSIAEKVKAWREKRRLELSVRCVDQVDCCYNESDDSSFSVVHIARGYKKGFLGNPSEVDDFFWVQAPVTDQVASQWENITRFSGKFVLSIPKDRIDKVWNRFKDDHKQGLLGFALRARTEKKDSVKDLGANRFLTVHLGNCFDIKEVSRVALQIKKLWDELELPKDDIFVFSDVSTEIVKINSNSPLAKELYSFRTDELKNISEEEFQAKFGLRVDNSYKKAEIDMFIRSS